MKTLVILAHSNFESSRINKRLAKELESYDDITLHNLTEVYKDENIDVKKEQELLLKHDRIVFQFPLYWYSSPHILKKYQDVVLEYGFAYGSKGTALRGKGFLCAVSVGANEVSYQSGGFNNYSMSEILRPFQAMSNLTGMKFLPSFKIYSTHTLSDEALEVIAKEYPKYILSSDLDSKNEIAKILKLLDDKMKNL